MQGFLQLPFRFQSSPITSSIHLLFLCYRAGQDGSILRCRKDVFSPRAAKLCIPIRLQFFTNISFVEAMLASLSEC